LRSRWASWSHQGQNRRFSTAQGRRDRLGAMGSPCRPPPAPRRYRGRGRRGPARPRSGTPGRSRAHGAGRAVRRPWARTVPGGRSLRSRAECACWCSTATCSTARAPTSTTPGWPPPWPARGTPWSCCRRSCAPRSSASWTPSARGSTGVRRSGSCASPCASRPGGRRSATSCPCTWPTATKASPRGRSWSAATPRSSATSRPTSPPCATSPAAPARTRRWPTTW
jgi:hypothetical protein